MAWYNTYRPTTFEEVIGQNLVKDILEKSLEKNVIKHAYLFSGPKGIGKTTIARIFAHELNKIADNPEAKLDIIEMDAASNTGIDDIRQLLESAKSEPLSAPYKIYIIDEVHMLSKSAMNALLKILEEPPEYIIFLLATTNPEKLIPTVLSRLTKLPLHAHTLENIVENLEVIATKEGVQIDKQALQLIAKRSEGSQRDAINLLETVSAYQLDNYSVDKVSELLGLLPDDVLESAGQSILNGITPESIKRLSGTATDGVTFLSQLMDYAIEKSFRGDTSLDRIIIPVAETLGLRLPYTSITSALALVSQKIKTPAIVTAQAATAPKVQEVARPEETVRSVTPPPAPTPPPVELPPDQPEPVPVEPATIQTPPRPEPTPAPQPVSITAPAGKKSSAHETIMELNNSAKCPPILKMIIPDLLVSDGEGDELVLSVTNGIFSAQLGSSKLQTFLREHLLKETQKSYSFKVEQRAKGNEPIPLPPEEKEPTAPVATEPPAEDTPTKTTEVKLTTGKITGKIFYKVFKQLPPEMKEGDLPVYTEPIPVPEKSPEDEWSEVEDMFELE